MKRALLFFSILLAVSTCDPIAPDVPVEPWESEDLTLTV